MGLIPQSPRSIIIFLVLFAIGSAPFVSSTLYASIMGTQAEMSNAFSGYSPYDLDIPYIGVVLNPVINPIMHIFIILADTFVLLISYMGIIATLPSILPPELGVPLTFILILGFIFGSIAVIWGNSQD